MCSPSERLLGAGGGGVPVEDAGGAGREGEGPLAAVDQEGDRVQPSFPSAGFLLTACLRARGSSEFY